MYNSIALPIIKLGSKLTILSDLVLYYDACDPLSYWSV
jgi:hypothetical protein